MKLGSFVLPFALLAGTAASAATLNTIGAEDSGIFSWGLPDTAAYGQTLTFGAAATINDFTFRVNDAGTAIDYIAYIFAWDGVKTSGSALLASAGSTSGNGVMSDILVSAGNLAVSMGQYVAFLQATSAGDATWGSVGSADAYGGGAFVFQNNSGDESEFGTVGWQTDWQGPGYDLAFAVSYDVAAIPVPAALPLMLLALGGLGFAARRRTTV